MRRQEAGRELILLNDVADKVCKSAAINPEQVITK